MPEFTIGIPQLSSLCRTVSRWPRSAAEGKIHVEAIRAALGAPAVGILLPEDGIEALASERSPGLDEQAHHAAIFARIRPLIESIRADANGQRQVRLDDRAVSPYPGTPLTMALLSRISAETRSDPALKASGDQPAAAASQGRARLFFGWIYALLPGPASEVQDVAFASLSNHLGNLALIARLEDQIAVRDQFLSIASHELKTPLTSIYGLLQLQERLLGKPQELDRQKSFQKTMTRQIVRLNELIDGLLDVSRIQNGRFVVEAVDTDVAALLRETVEGRLAIRATEAEAKLQVDCSLNLHAWVDPIRFEEVVTNLVMNAIRFSPEGGVVWIKLKDDGECLRLTVRDQGESLPEADRDRVFQPFERAKRSSRLGGLGLGLFISRQIARLHGGDVELLESEAGRGNLFEARFPLRGAKRVSA